MTASALSGAYFALRDITWQGSTQLHSLMDVAATLLMIKSSTRNERLLQNIQQILART